MVNEETRAQYNNMAQSYDALADSEEKLAASAAGNPDPGAAPPSAIEI